MAVDGEIAISSDRRPGLLRRAVGWTSVRLYAHWCRGRDKAFSLAIGGDFAAFGSRSVVQLPLRLTGARHMAIGDRVFIGSGSWLQVLGSDHEAVALRVGDGTSIVGSCVLSARRSVTIGREVLMARNVYVADHMHAFGDDARAVLAQGIDRVAGVEIGDGAWLGQNVVIGPGVRVGRGAVVGANSVVLHDVPDGEVAVGAPARVLERSRESAQTT